MPSVEQLDVLLLFHFHSDRTWDESSVSDALRNNPDSGRAILESLNRLGLVSRTENSRATYQYCPRNRGVACGGGAPFERVRREKASRDRRYLFSAAQRSCGFRGSVSG